MSSERFWILVLTLTTFLAGGAGGFLLAMESVPARDSGALATYRERLSDRYQLPAEARRKLAQILEVYEEDIERLKSRQLDVLDPELVQAGSDCLDRIETYVLAPLLTPDQLAAFRAECGLGDAPASSQGVPPVH